MTILPEHNQTLLDIFMAASRTEVPAKRLTCPDQFVGYIGPDGYTDDGDEFAIRENMTGLPMERLAIILVLESPHHQELGTKPYGPAKGPTGKKIRKHIGKALGDRLDGLVADGPRPLILMNAIQYQTSLGAPTEYHRDTIFQAMWANEAVQDDFKRRLRAYAVRGSFVINACTTGNRGLPRKLYELVEDAIFEALDRPRDMGINHPGNWITNPRTGQIRFARRF